MDNASTRVLDAYIRRTGQSQAGFARSLGLSQTSIWQWANGHRFPGKKAARLLDEATDGVIPFSLWKAVKIDLLDA
jgi:transcriptional regulator with XRE-family HTH domain